MATSVKIQEFGKNKQIMVTIPRAVAQLLGYTKGRQAKWILDEDGKLTLALEAK